MQKVDLKLLYTPGTTGAKKGTTTISDVNPSAEKAPLLQMAQGFNALTTNNYVETTRVATVNLDTEDPTPSGKETRVVTVTNPVKGESTDVTISKESDETLSPTFLYDSGGTVSTWSVTKVMGTEDTIVKYRGNIPSDATSLCIGVAETNDYYPVFKPVTLS